MKAKKTNQFKENPPSELSPFVSENLTGIAGEHIGESFPKFKKEITENVITSQNNAEIVLGRDTKGVAGGEGWKGHASAGAIDIVAGRGSCILNTINSSEEKQWIRNDYRNDGARIYVSQKTNLDEYFSLPSDSTSPALSGVSGIAIKADTVRVVSRNNIKLVASCDRIMSNETDNNTKVGIDLICSIPYNGEENYNEQMSLVEGRDDMQPIPKGENLRSALRNIAEMLDTLSGILINFIKIQHKFNLEIASHTHIETFFGNQGVPSVDVIGPMMENSVNVLEECTADTFEYKVQYLNNFINTYLSEFSAQYINSKYHRLN